MSFNKRAGYKYCFSASDRMPGISVFIFIIMLIMPAGTTAQESDTKPSRETAERLYLAGDFTNALIHYSLLNDKFPADPLYKYYGAVCMVKIEKDPGIAANLLLEAIENSSQIRNVPPDGWFYLGRAYQLAGSFEKAGYAYDVFRDKVRRKEAREYDLDRYISECYNNINLSSDLIADTTEVSDNNIIHDTVSMPEPVTEPVIIDHDYDMVVRAALDAQFKADSLSRLADRYRKNLNTVSGSDRETIRSKILNMEELQFSYQSEANKKFTEAARLNNEIPVDQDIMETSTKAVAGDKNDESTLMTDPEANDSVTVMIDTVIVTPEPEPEPILVIFSDNTVQPASIPVNSKMPDGLYYRIQTAAFRNPVDPLFFKTVGPVYGLKAGNSEITFYFIGLFRKKADAERSLLKVHNTGFSDAFVVPVSDGRRVSFEKADALEKEWGETALADSVPGRVKVEAKPGEPLTLVYRVEVKRTKKPLKEDELELFRIVAGERDFDILENSAGKEYVYLIGKFLTFDSAWAYSDLLFRNGLEDAHVVAYLGNNEIPVEKAKELFDLYFDK
ncbi:MAG: hypothetical protein K8R35_00565 [Bacteroidales bacterium]|nr:hypothetical protein [Bacteroidales bacterium]